MKKLLPTLILPLLVACGPLPHLIDEPLSMASQAPDASILSDLVSQELSKEEQEVRSLLTRPIQLNFPVRVGVIPYQFYSTLDQEKQQDLFLENKSELESNELIKEFIQIPNALLPHRPSMDTFRQLGARFQVDIVLVLTGENSFEKVNNKAIPFFESFTNQAYWKGQSKLETLAVDTFSGLFLTPVKSFAKQDSALLDPGQMNFEDEQSKLQSEAERMAWKIQKDQLITRLQSLKSSTVKAGN